MDADLKNALDAFERHAPSTSRFTDVGSAALYAPLPDGWLIGHADIVNSTRAVEAGRYKHVTFVGAAVITAIGNALGGLRFPFSFGGDGASFAVPMAAHTLTRDALAAIVAWAEDAFGFTLRAALVPIEEVRAGGVDVQVGRFAASPHASFALFSGGGLEWLDQRMKTGHCELIGSAATGAPPDLTGLSCRWRPFPSRHGVIVSLIVAPGAHGVTPAYRSVVARTVALVNNHSPVSEDRARLSVSAQAIALEARGATRGPFILRFARLLPFYLLARFVMMTGMSVGAFSPQRYRRQSVLNSDFRKYSDSLMVTADCDAATLERLRATLDAARADGVVRYGLHTQDAALMTCIVPSEIQDDHLHFIDGASGGYAMAAAVLKRGM